MDSTSSLFTYPPDKDYLTYRNESFVPPFSIGDLFDTPAQKELAVGVCGSEDDLNCLFDYAATGSALVAAATQSAQQTASAQKETLGKWLVCLTLSDILKFDTDVFFTKK